jgi:hypothetical protein
MFAFTDQSGNIHKNDSVQRPVLLTLCMMESEVRGFTRLIHNIKERIFGPEDEENPREIKALDLLNPKSLTTRTNNKEFAERVLDDVGQFGVTVFAAVMERPGCEIPEERMLPNRYRYLLERVSFHAERNHSKALLLYDEERQEKFMWRAINNFLFKHAVGQDLYIHEMPLFVKSIITPGIQVADLMAGVVRHYYELNLDKRSPENSFEEWICYLFDIVRNLSSDYQNFRGTINYGIFLMPKGNY